MQKHQLKIGAIGSVALALCCFTPVLVILLGAIGAAALLPWLDYVLIPGLLFFLCLTAYAWLNTNKSGESE